ncbi:MAG: PAS domain S-box protein [Hyphomicrobiaceae bacterium]
MVLAADGIGTWVTDLETGLTKLDHKAAVIWGLPDMREVSQSEIEGHIHPNDRDARRAALARALNPEGDGRYDTAYRITALGDRPAYWVVVSGRVTFNGTSPLQVSGTVRDVTAGKDVEQVLAHSQLMLSSLVDQANDAIISIDHNQRITLFNRGAERLFGYAAAEIMGQPLDALIPMNARAAHKSHIAVFGQSRETSRRMAERGTIFGQRKDGTAFPAEASISRLELPSGTAFTAIVRDITDNKRHEAELEARVAERTRALEAEIRHREATQAALVRSQRMDALGQLTGGIAHDSNNLLTVISGNLEMLEDELPDHPALKYLHEAQEAAKMGARLNERLLTFSRRRKLEPQVIHLNDQVIAMSDLLRRTLGEAVTLTTLLAHDLWPTRADPSEVENAILNLAINARDAMPSGGGLRIETLNKCLDADIAQLEDGLVPGDYVQLSVSDTGVGMPAEVVRRAFEPFFTTKGIDKGTGLGLSTLYGFVKQTGGHVSIYSEIDRGTTVNVFLPRIADAAAEPRADADAQELPLGRGETILVVEDNHQVRALTQERLKRLGYSTLAAESGPSALEIFGDGEKVDLVFSDVVMAGGMSGFELAHALRQRMSSVRILLTSGFAEDAAKAGERSDAELVVLQKPYPLAELAQRVRATLDGR